MRSQPTPAEQRLWQALRGGRLHGLKFRRQHAIGRFIVDFYCVRAALVVEIDGQIHSEQCDADQERQGYIEAMGLSVVRFSNDQVMENLDTVLQTIRTAATLANSPSPLEGEGAGG
jgi:very-short-patch-repair endonuclease